LIVTIIALVAGQIRVVQAAILGSIFSHLLLVLGMCFLVAGIEFYLKDDLLEQVFSSTAAQMSSSVMTLACISLVIPAAFSLLINGNNNVTTTSNINEYDIAIKEVKEETNEPMSVDDQTIDNNENREQHMDEENGVPMDKKQKIDRPISIIAALTLLIIMTVIIGFSAEFLVKSIEGIVESHKISKTFIGIILFPIVGHGAKYFASLRTARKNEMNAVIIISVGSATQTALFITPILVLLGWIINQPMSLAFLPFETICLFIAVILKNYLVQ
ncbi:14388_t:CDS:2, partial [Gigaspora margarita]